MNNRKNNILRLVELALLAALVVVLQFMGSFIKIGPLPMSFVLIPIVIGAILRGPKAGAVLGGVFGVVTVIMGIAGVDAFSAMLWNANPVCFVLICMLKATLAGFGSGLVYKGLQLVFKGKYITLSTVLAAVAAPVLNTGVFVIGMLVCYFGVMESLPTLFPQAFGQFGGAVSVVFLGLAGFNFIGEFLVNLVLSPAIVRIVDIVQKKIAR